MDLQANNPGTAELLCDKLSQYFGNEYEISSNHVDVVTIRSGLKASVYVESEDIMIVNSIANDFGMSVEKWRIVVANQQVGIYFVLAPQPDAVTRIDIEARRLPAAGERAVA